MRAIVIRVEKVDLCENELFKLAVLYGVVCRAMQFMTRFWCAHDVMLLNLYWRRDESWESHTIRIGAPVRDKCLNTRINVNVYGCVVLYDVRVWYRVSGFCTDCVYVCVCMGWIRQWRQCLKSFRINLRLFRCVKSPRRCKGTMLL